MNDEEKLARLRTELSGEVNAPAKLTKPSRYSGLWDDDKPIKLMPNSEGRGLWSSPPMPVETKPRLQQEQSPVDVVSPPRLALNPDGSMNWEVFLAEVKR